MAWVFLITGGSSGFGYSLALQALRAGHKVIAATRNSAKARDAKPGLEKLGGQWLTLDVTSPDTEKIVSNVVKENGVNVLVNSAGFALLGAFEDMSLEEIHDEINTNYYGCLRTMKGVIPTFREQKQGTIVNISSGAGFAGLPSRSLYAGSKFALEGTSEALSKELAPFNIRVLIVEPGAFRSNFIDTLVFPKKGLSEPYKGTEVDTIIQKTQELPTMKLGNTEIAGKRILEVVTGIGMGESEAVKKCLRLPLGEDCYNAAKEKSKTFEENLEVMREITLSTGLED